MSDYRIYVDANIDDKNISEARLYFRNDYSPTYQVYSQMSCVETLCRGIVLAPQGNVGTIYYTVVYKNAKGVIGVSDEYQMHQRSQLALDNQTKDKTPIELGTELKILPKLVGYNDRYSIYKIKNQDKIGVLAGVIDKYEAGVVDTSVINARLYEDVLQLKTSGYIAIGVVLLVLFL